MKSDDFGVRLASMVVGVICGVMFSAIVVIGNTEDTSTPAKAYAVYQKELQKERTRNQEAIKGVPPEELK